MAIQIKDTYATVFDPTNHDKFVKSNISTSRKTTIDGDKKYVNSYWNGTFVGKAKDPASKLVNKDRIKIVSGYISHEPSSKTGDNGKPIYFYNLTIFEFEKLDSTNAAQSSTGTDNSSVEEGDLPF